MSGPLRGIVIAVGFAIPAVVVYVVLRWAWPTQHDLSDIGTGLMRIGLALAAGLAGAVMVAVLARRT